MSISAFKRGWERGALRDRLRQQQRITPQDKRMLELRIETALVARRTAPAPTITDDDLERMMLEWSIVREELDAGTDTR